MDTTSCGCTLWTDFALFGVEQRELTMYEAGMKMSDYRKILRKASETSYPKLKPRDTLLHHHESKSWLLNELNGIKKGKAVIVTHMAPSIKSLAVGVDVSSLGATYASDLESVVADEKVELRIHGHTHLNVDYKIGDTRVVSNQYGYHGVEPADNFRADWMVELC